MAHLHIREYSPPPPTWNWESKGRVLLTEFLDYNRVEFEKVLLAITLRSTEQFPSTVEALLMFSFSSLQNLFSVNSLRNYIFLHFRKQLSPFYRPCFRVLRVFTYENFHCMSSQELRGPLHFKFGGLNIVKRRSLLLDWYLMYHFPLILFLNVLFLKIKNCNIIVL